MAGCDWTFRPDRFPLSTQLTPLRNLWRESHPRQGSSNFRRYLGNDVLVNENLHSSILLPALRPSDKARDEGTAERGENEGSLGRIGCYAKQTKSENEYAKHGQKYHDVAP